ncbi:serine/threonine-protein kinase pim-3 [Eurytemora carolleeae]|uniref:serine/threonine-protein kinase pim-3 n=1 Tax=Eurytemora carolleeae TaxID=1294199 RepID=UPI000C790EB6|nr:serine/threonine-protein kinase pim-3 [Eurytemora carolleeae]|eukprot:XP_023331145.1 serine/threonine-protein kinase pim-3-like [Eurytemora affinis]
MNEPLVVSSIQECEACGVVHRDIKDENILVNPVTLETKLIDLGSAVYSLEDNSIPFDGTGVYAPPELLLYGWYNSSACTAWSLGILLYNMLVGDIPFHTFSEICYLQVKFPRGLEDLHLKELILGCLQRDPEKRLASKDLLSHPWCL